MGKRKKAFCLIGAIKYLKMKAIRDGRVILGSDKGITKGTQVKKNEAKAGLTAHSGPRAHEPMLVNLDQTLKPSGSLPCLKE